MTSNRFRPGNYSCIVIPAAQGLINTAITPQRLNIKWARDIENMIPVQSKKLSKRKGCRNMAITGIADGVTIVNHAYFVTPEGVLQLLAFTDTGSIYRTSGAMATWELIKSGLSVNGTFGTCQFNAKLVIYNGVDPMMTYNGTAVTTVTEYVNDLGIPFTKITSSQLRFKPLDGFGATNYPTGRTIRITMNSGDPLVPTVVTATINTSSYNSTTGLLTVNLNGTPLSGTNITKVEYLINAQAFRFVYPYKNRLWALGPAVLKPNFNGGANPLTVYVTYFTNNETIWTAPETQGYAFINMENTHGINDEFLAIAAYQNGLIFFGRQRAQVWTGTNPVTINADFSFNKIVAIGLLHPFLIQELEQDLVFYTKDGSVRSFTRVNQTNDIETRQDAGSNIRTISREQTEAILGNETFYRRARSFRYPRGSFYGFKLYDETQVNFVDKDSIGWVRFTGLFSYATAFTNAPDDKLYLSIGNVTYVYATDENRYSDDGQPFKISWTTPWVQPKDGRNWANRKLELETDPGAEATMQVNRYKNNDDGVAKTTDMLLPSEAAYWDEADWDVSFWDANEGAKYSRAEDKFIAYTMCWQVTNTSTVGPIDIVSLNIFGQVER